MKMSALQEYCSLRNLTTNDGLELLKRAIKEASRTKNAITAVEADDNSGDIYFYAHTTDGDYREIALKPSMFEKAHTLFAKMVWLHTTHEPEEQNEEVVVRGVISEVKDNGWFISLPTMVGFLPKDKSIDKEAQAGHYAIGKTLYFTISESTVQARCKPRIILSRRDLKLAHYLAEAAFSIYGFVSIKRKPGEKQTIIVRAYPQRNDQLKYQSYFPCERINFRKMLSDGTIKAPAANYKRGVRNEQQSI